MKDNIPNGLYTKERVKILLSLVSFVSTPSLLNLLKDSDSKASRDVYSFTPKLLILRAIEKLGILTDHISFLDLKDYLVKNDLKEYLSPREVEEKLSGYISHMEYEGLLVGMKLTDLSKEILSAKKEVDHLFSISKETLN